MMMRSIRQIILISFLSFTTGIAIGVNVNNDFDIDGNDKLSSEKKKNLLRHQYDNNNQYENSNEHQKILDDAAVGPDDNSNDSSSSGDGNDETTITVSTSPEPSVTPSSNSTTISPSPSVAPTPIPSNKTKTAAPTTAAPITPAPTTAPPTTVAPTIPPTAPQDKDHHKHKHHDWWKKVWKLLLKTVCWLFIAGLFFFAFGALMSNRYRIYYYVRGSWYTLLHKMKFWRRRQSSNDNRNNSSAPSSTLNEIIFSDNNDLQEGLLMRET